METFVYLPFGGFVIYLFVLFCLWAGLGKFLLTPSTLSRRQFLVFAIVCLVIISISAFCGMKLGDKNAGLGAGFLSGLMISLIAGLFLAKEDGEWDGPTMITIIFIGVIFGSVSGALASFYKFMYPCPSQTVFFLSFPVMAMVAMIFIEYTITAVKDLIKKFKIKRAQVL